MMLAVPPGDSRRKASGQTMMLIKVLAAFCLGALMLAGLQTIGVRSLQQYLKSDRARAGMPVIGKAPHFAANFKASGIREALLPKGGLIDTREGQRLAVEGAAR